MSTKAKSTTQLKGFDFLDFGASKGASIDYGIKHLFGKKGMGVDLDPARVELMNQSGYNCMVGDLTDLHLPANCVRFVKMSHILEHMPSLDGVEKAIGSAKKVATDFLVITGPFFDEDEYLVKNGFKLHWSDYPEHTCHLTVKQLVSILKKLNLNDYELYVRYKIRDSKSEHIHSLKSPAGSHHYKNSVHPPKKNMSFDRDIWTDFVCYVKLKKDVSNWAKITKAYRNQVPLIEMTKGKKYMWDKKATDKIAELEEELQSSSEQLHLHKLNEKKLKDALIELRNQAKKITKKSHPKLIRTYAGKAKRKVKKLISAGKK